CGSTPPTTSSASASTSSSPACSPWPARPGSSGSRASSGEDLRGRRPGLRWEGARTPRAGEATGRPRAGRRARAGAFGAFPARDFGELAGGVDREAERTGAFGSLGGGAVDLQLDRPVSERHRVAARAEGAGFTAGREDLAVDQGLAAAVEEADPDFGGGGEGE